MNWWNRRDRGSSSPGAGDRKPGAGGGWTRCKGCGEILQEAELEANLGVCHLCDFHHPISTRRRLSILLDPDSLTEIGEGVAPVDPLRFKDRRRYRDRLKAARKRSGLSEAAVVGLASIDGTRVAVGALAFEFMGGSMGSVVGERITRLLEAALEHRLPAVISSTSGGARMQEGILALMQMAKTSAALRRHRDAGLPFVSLLHHPTTGGVAASFAMLGDVIIAEPRALIGFAGPRVIAQATRRELPEEFQRAESLLEHGMVDMITPRKDLRQRLSFLLRALRPHRAWAQSDHG